MTTAAAALFLSLIAVASAEEAAAFQPGVQIEDRFRLEAPRSTEGVADVGSTGPLPQPNPLAHPL